MENASKEYTGETMTIFFKTGRELEVSLAIVEVLTTELLAGCKQWQMFFDENNKLFLMINLDDISFIKTKKYDR